MQWIVIDKDFMLCEGPFQSKQAAKDRAKWWVDNVRMPADFLRVVALVDPIEKEKQK